MMDQLHQAEIPLIHWVQHLGMPRFLIEALSWFGVEIIVALAVALFFGWDRKLGARLLALYFAADLLNLFLKVIFHSPRPYWFDRSVQNLSNRGEHVSYGFPSGHAQNAATAWGALAFHFGSAGAWIAAGVLLFLVALSRVYLGVHFPSDTIGGILAGFGLAFAWVKLERPLNARFHSWTRARQAVVIVSLASLVVLAAWLIFHEWSPAHPQAWADKAESARSIGRLATPLGGLVGLAFGLSWAAEHAAFDPGGPWRLRLARILIGGGVVGGIIKLVHLWKFEGLQEFLWRFALSCVLTIWVTCVAPKLFLRYGLARQL